MNFSGTPFNKMQHQRTARSTKSNAAFKLRETEIMGLRNLYLYSKMSQSENSVNTIPTEKDNDLVLMHTPFVRTRYLTMDSARE